MLINIRDNLKCRKGSLVVEAAVFLPIFIIGIMTLGYLVKYTAVQENVFHSFADETGKVAAQASLTYIKDEVAVPPSFFGNSVTKRLNDENGHEIKNVGVSHFDYMIYHKGYDELIAASVDCDIDIILPVKILDSIPASETIVCRAFVGDEQMVEPMPFSEMEKNIGSETAWIFPKSGTRYHEENCSFIKNYPIEMLLISSVRRQYSPCKICDPGTLGDGNLVYCFITGNVYHRGECSTVTKYVTSIEKQEAVNRGYLPCGTCGGV